MKTLSKSFWIFWVVLLLLVQWPHIISSRSSLEMAQDALPAQGTVKGLTYSAQLETMDETGNWSLAEAYDEREEVQETNSYSDSLNIVSSVENTSTWYQYLQYIYDSQGGLAEENWGSALYEADNPYEVGADYNISIETLLAQLDANTDGDWYSLVEGVAWEVDVYSYDREWLGTIRLEAFFLEIYDSSNALTEMFFFWPEWVEADATALTIPVQVAETFSAAWNMSGQWESWYAYEATITTFEVEISDFEDKLHFIFDAPIDSEVSFQEYAHWIGTVSEEYRATFDVTFQEAGELEFSNGTLFNYSPGDTVPEELLPAWLWSYYWRSEGSYDEEWYQEGDFRSRGTMQSYVFSIEPPSNESARVTWSNFVPGILLGYEEMTNDDYYTFAWAENDVQLAEDVEPTQEDFVRLFADLEAYSENVTYWEARDSTYSYKYEGSDWSLSDDNVHDSGNHSDSWSWQVGDFNADFSYSPSWTEPEVNNDSVTFSWGISYSNVPVTWFDLYTGNEITEYQDISYTYDFVVDSSADDHLQAVLSTTALYGEITDSDLKRATDGLSLASISTSEFLTTEIIQSEVNGTLAAPVTNPSFSFSGMEIAEIEFGGTKRAYDLTLDGDTNTYNSTSLMIVLYKEQGTLRTENSNGLDSYDAGSLSRLGDVFTQQSVDTESDTAIDYNYQESLVIISYPVWNGGQIKHDPTYTAISGKSAGQNGTGTESENPDTGFVPGFGIEIMVLAMFASMTLFAKRKTTRE